MSSSRNKELLSLHSQIENAEIEQRKLEDLLYEKSIQLKRNKTATFLLKVICVILLLTTITCILYTIYWTNDDKNQPVVVDTIEFSALKSEINSLKNQLDLMQKEQTNLKELNDIYLYRKLIKKDTIYSVQIQSLTKAKVGAISKKYVNAKFYNDTSYFKFSIGIFETLQEAQEFKKTLTNSGVIKKSIFVISYKDGKRIRIENAN